jgi:hypothetical protein
MKSILCSVLLLMMIGCGKPHSQPQPEWVAATEVTVTFASSGEQINEQCPVGYEYHAPVWTTHADGSRTVDRIATDMCHLKVKP